MKLPPVVLDLESVYANCLHQREAAIDAVAAV